MNKWIRRKRNSWGYGVQSPSDFYFVQHVLREQSPYYAYAALEEMTATYGALLPHYPDAVNRLLVRLANHLHPSTIIEVGAGISTFAMSMACPSARCTAITLAEECAATMRKLATNRPNIEIKNGDEIGLFSLSLQKDKSIGMLHIAHTSHYREVVEAALPYATDSTLFVIEGITDNRQKHEWWKSLQENPLTSISYDLGHIGLLFFDSTRHKSTYWINLRKRT